MPLEIRRNPKARADVLDIWNYIAPDSLRSADRVIDRFSEVFALLAAYPEIGTEHPELGGGIRSFPDGRFVIYFRRTGEVLEIVRVVAAARKVSPDLFEP
jgi:toxin ParE1/3/4